jgi:hypothetical protein
MRRGSQVVVANGLPDRGGRYLQLVEAINIERYNPMVESRGWNATIGSQVCVIWERRKRRRE